MSILPLRCSAVPNTRSWPVGFEAEDFQRHAQEEGEQKHARQWVSEVVGVSSQFGHGDEGGWTARKIVGPPSVRRYGDDGNSLAFSSVGTREEYVDVKVARPCKIEEIRITESLCPGALEVVSLWDGQQMVEVYRRWANCGRHPREIRIQEVHIPIEHQHVVTDRFRLDFNQQGGETWYEIDAIEVIGKFISDGTMKFQEYLEPSSERQGRIADSVASLFKDERTCDCHLLVSEDMGDCSSNPEDRISKPEDFSRIAVHRGILAARSPLFAMMLNNGELPLGSEKRIAGISPDLMLLLLEWIYTGTIAEMDAFNAIALMATADYYQVSDLVCFCLSQYVSRVLNIGRAAVLYQHWCSTGLDKLRDITANFIARHFLHVSKTKQFKSLEREQLLHLIELYGAHQKVSCKRKRGT